MTASPGPHAIQTTLRPQQSLEGPSYALKVRDAPAPNSFATHAPPDSLASSDRSLSSISHSPSASLSPSLPATNAPNNFLITSFTSSAALPEATAPLVLVDSVRLTTVIASAPLPSSTALSTLQVQPVCIGQGLDAQSLGLLSTLVVPSVVGLGLWVGVDLNAIT